MRNRDLYGALRQFALDAAGVLSEDLAAGGEIPFDVLAEQGPGGVLYNYRPLTEEFVGTRWKQLRRLPTFPPAAEALRFAAAHPAGDGPPRVDADPALLAMLERLWQDATGFDFPDQRFERVYAELEELVYRRATRVTVMAPVYGPRLEPARLRLDDGLELVRPDVAEAPTDPHSGEAPGADDGAGLFIVFDRRLADDATFPLEDARGRLAALEQALRLLGLGAVAVGPVGWMRAEEGRWQAIAIGAAGARPSEAWTIYESDETGLTEMLAALGREHERPFGWALERFVAAGARADAGQALSDHLLALRALLDCGGDAGRKALPLRVAALCAEKQDRPATQRWIEVALDLERIVIEGGDGDGYAAAHGMTSVELVTRTVEDHLRSLLRDVVCGYLQPELARVADEILLQAGAPVEIEARDIRGEDEGASRTGLAEDESESSARERSFLGLEPVRFEVPGEPEPEPGPEPVPDPVPEPDEIPEPEQPEIVPDPVPEKDPDLEPVAVFDIEAEPEEELDFEPDHEAERDLGGDADFGQDDEVDYEPHRFTPASPYDFDEDAQSYAAPA